MLLRRFDLNLLVIFDVLMQERNITRSAAKLHMSQPAVSHALGRLRKQVDDPLLVRCGDTMEASPRALELYGVLGILPPNTAKASEAPMFTGL